MKYIFGAVPILIGLVAMVGWWLGQLQLTSWDADSVTMKLPTACLCVFGGLSVVLSRLWRDASWACGLVMAFVIFSVAGAFVSGGTLTTLDDSPVETVKSGMPSWGTLGAFVLVATQRLALVDRPLVAVAVVVWAVGLVAFIGHCFGLPTLYYYTSGKSTGMAIGTALSLMLCALGMFWEAVE